MLVLTPPPPSLLLWAPQTLPTRSGPPLLLSAPLPSLAPTHSHPYVLGVNASRPIYTDDPDCIAIWMAIFEEGGLPAVRASVHRQMQVMFPGLDIPQPTSDVFHRPKVRRAETVESCQS